MLYTSVTDESISEFRDWDIHKEYIVVASVQRLKGEYMIFEPNNSFTKYKEAILLSQSKFCQQVLYLYQILLPCELNPFLYIIFDEVESSALDLTGHSEADTIVYVRKKTETLVEDISESNFEKIGNDELRDIFYELTENGELKIAGELESVFCENKMDELENEHLKPYFFSTTLSPLRLVFKNEATELQLAKNFCTYCESGKPQLSIRNYKDTLINNFLHLFDSNGFVRDIEHQIRVIYRLHLSDLTIKETIRFIRDLLQSLRAKNSKEIDVVVSTHYLMLIDDSVDRINVRTVDSEKKAIYTIHFHPKYYNICNCKGESNTVFYNNIESTYGRILLP